MVKIRLVFTILKKKETNLILYQDLNRSLRQLSEGKREFKSSLNIQKQTRMFLDTITLSTFISFCLNKFRTNIQI